MFKPQQIKKSLNNLTWVRGSMNGIFLYAYRPYINKLIIIIIIKSLFPYGKKSDKPCKTVYIITLKTYTKHNKTESRPE